MLRICQFCRYSCNDAASTCRACGAPLPPDPAPPAPRSDRTGFGPAPPATEPWRRLAGLAGAVLLIVTVGGAIWAANGLLAAPGQTQDSAGRIKVGMHIAEVGRILDQGPPPSPSYPRMRDYFPADEFGDGVIDFEGDGEILRIHFIGGYVTAIEESPSSAGPGFHKYTMIVAQR
jgi:hypothetical protein